MTGIEPASRAVALVVLVIKRGGDILDIIEIG